MPTEYMNPQQIDTEKLWESVVNRDRYADGRFVFGVKTTGIFCRPTCPARRPKPENVEYFEDAESALKAGYRACKRCHPLGKHPDIELVERVRQIIEEQIDEPPTLAMIGADVGMSQFHVQRVFKRVTGISPAEYARARRIERFKDSARNGADVTRSLYDAGYGSSSRLYEDAPDRLGMTPGSYRRGGEGMEISYTIIDTDLGRVLIGATERGICAISIGEDD
ncbi:MAG: bifunctional transcriptional activator/DNA repair enzyme AdaA, partial [Chloroflexota bacterium]